MDNETPKAAIVTGASGGIGQPGEIASAVSFLAGPDGAWMNSQVVRVNGGFA